MPTMTFFVLLSLASLLTSCLSLALPTVGGNGKVGVVDISIPSNRHDDQYYVANLDFNGQTIPVLIDTASGDLFVGSNQCSTTNSTSGCYRSPVYQIDNQTTIIANETFGTVVGVAGVIGNQSIMPVDFGGVTVPDLATPLLFYAGQGEFQNGSFGGIFGLAPRNVSRNYYFFERLPPVEAMITKGLLEKPVMSLTLPRLGDPASPTTGKLTFGAIEDVATIGDISYNDIIDTPNYGYEDGRLSPQSWTSQLLGVRMNGVEINLTRSSIDAEGRYLSLFDSGAQTILLRYQEFTAVAALFHGPTIVQDGYAVFFDCSIPQLLELKYHGDDRWFAVDPLDLIIPSDHGVVNGTVMCKSALGTWSRTFADSIMGVPFMRNVLSVFDYKTEDLYSVQPRVGLGALTDAKEAVGRYAEVYQNRLL
ncbi:acid protease [Diplodia corticola]|uniref:Acid protease n=1 Tax=Diplodia corticola TaxID=236234 RepID=A0A1J9QX51_9PEZI|nr:acid protease [Diplodia corticola]OJD32562.1 acid protease [Diplodia corticola]